MVRRHILTIASKSYPRPVDFELLRATLGTLGYPITQSALEFYLRYLEEKGCVKLERREAYDLVMVTITAKGIDVLDGRISECGIE
jgi:repressor of nif and glnA expression